MKKHVVKDYFTGALFALLKKKSFQSITVSDLVKKSGASRASFYRNYESKEQIVDEFCKQVFGDVFEEHPINVGNIRGQVCRIFLRIHDHHEELLLLRQAGLLDYIDKYVFDGTMAQINDNQVLNNKYQPYFFAGAASAMIKAWIEFGFLESPEEIAEYFFRSLKGYMTYE